MNRAIGFAAAYTAQTTPAAAGNGTVAIRLSRAVGGLAPGTVYRYRIVAVSSAGATAGAGLTFKTASDRPPQARALPRARRGLRRRPRPGLQPGGADPLSRRRGQVLAGALDRESTPQTPCFWTDELVAFGQMSATIELARELNVSDRTLRRAVSRELLRGARRSANRLVLSDDERAYVRSHWGLLQTLVAALRTEPGVEAAVLYGSVAKGTDDAGSDVDLLVKLRAAATTSAPALERRLTRAAGRRVHVVRLEDGLADGGFALEIIDHGRPLADRGDVWPSLRRRRAALARKAAARAAAREHEMAAAWERLVRAA
jgi:predicted nucleotidyltransferase